MVSDATGSMQYFSLADMESSAPARIPLLTLYGKNLTNKGRMPTQIISSHYQLLTTIINHKIINHMCIDSGDMLTTNEKEAILMKSD